MNTLVMDKPASAVTAQFRPETANLPAIREDRPLVSLEDADPARAARIQKLMNEANIKDTNSIVTFGAAANSELTKVSEQILGNARNKEFGAAGNLINDMVTQLRGFDPRNIDKDLSWWQRVVKKITPLMKAIQRYEAIQSQLGTITGNLERHKTELMKHIAVQDRMEAAIHVALDGIEEYIAAGEARMAAWNANELVEAQQAAAASDDARAAQLVTDVQNQIRLMERTVHGLKLTRQVTLQSIPRIDLLQDNDTNLVSKIDGLLTHALPMWKQQLAQALMIQQMSEAADAVKAAGDLTNDLLVSNAEGLKEANAKVRTEIERGTFDIEAIEKANTLLIDTLRETAEIYQAGSEARKDAEGRLVDAEKALKDAMLEHKNMMSAA